MQECRVSPALEPPVPTPVLRPSAACGLLTEPYPRPGVRRVRPGRCLPPAPSAWRSRLHRYLIAIGAALSLAERTNNKHEVQAVGRLRFGEPSRGALTAGTRAQRGTASAGLRAPARKEHRDSAAHRPDVEDVCGGSRYRAA